MHMLLSLSLVALFRNQLAGSHSDASRKHLVDVSPKRLDRTHLPEGALEFSEEASELSDDDTDCAGPSDSTDEPHGHHREL